MDRRPVVEDDRLLRRSVEWIATSPLDGPLAMLDGIGAPDRSRLAIAVELWRLVRQVTIDPAITFILKWQRRQADLHYLQSLDDHMLKDIGVSRCDVEREVKAGWFPR